MSMYATAWRAIAATALALALASPATAQKPGDTPPVREEMALQAQALHGFVRSKVGNDFLNAVSDLGGIRGPRVVYRNKETRAAASEKRRAEMSAEERKGYEREELDERFFYYTRYGTPLAFVRPLDLLGRSGLESLDGARVLDFGFGSIGQLRLMAANGAHAHGIDVEPLLEELYSHTGDTGRVARAKSAGVGNDGEVTLHFGQWPAENTLVGEVNGGYEVFISKNTLKNGYIHPAEDVDPRYMVHLGVADEYFVRMVYNALSPGGWFMIYNLCPRQSPDRYIPWADGNSPFSRELLEQTGFTVIAYNEDDTAAARHMGEILGWGADMNLETDLTGTYTLMRKPQDRIR